MYADDGHVFATSRESIAAALGVIRVFERASGAELNVDKCELVVYGPHARSEEARREAGLPGLPARRATRLSCLGVPCWDPGVSTSEECVTRAWAEPLSRLRLSLAAWSRLGLTLRGKVLVAQTVGLSQLWYAARFYPMPAWVVRPVCGAVASFVWGTAAPGLRLDYASLVSPTRSGGLGMLEVASQANALLAGALLRAYDARSFGPHAQLAFFHLAHCRPDETYDAGWLPGLGVRSWASSADPQIPPFFHAALRACREAGVTVAPPESGAALRQLPLWRNPSLPSTAVGRSWARAGITRVGHVLTAAGGPGHGTRRCGAGSAAR